MLICYGRIERASPETCHTYKYITLTNLVRFTYCLQTLCIYYTYILHRVCGVLIPAGTEADSKAQIHTGSCDISCVQSKMTIPLIFAFEMASLVPLAALLTKSHNAKYRLRILNSGSIFFYLPIPKEKRYTFN